MFIFTKRFMIGAVAIAAMAGGVRPAQAGLDFVVDDFEDTQTTVAENWGNALYYGEIDASVGTPYNGLPSPVLLGQSFAVRSRTTAGGFAGTGLDPAAPKLSGFFSSNKVATYAVGAFGSKYYRHATGSTGAISNVNVSPAVPLEYRHSVGMNLARTINVVTPSFTLGEYRTAPAFDATPYRYFRVTAYTPDVRTVNSAFCLQLETSDTVQIVNKGLASAYTQPDPATTVAVIGRPHMSVGPWTDALTTRPAGFDIQSTPTAFIVDITDTAQFKQDSFYRNSTSNSLAGLTPRTNYLRNKIDNIWLGWVRFGNDALTGTELTGGFFVDDMMFLEKAPAVELTSTTSVLAEDAPGVTTTSLFAKLSARPTHDVTVTFGTTDTAALTVSPATLTFTPANYDVPQSVSVSSVDQNSVVDRVADIQTGIVTQDLFYGQRNPKGVFNVARPTARFFIRQAVPVTMSGHSIGD